MKHKALNKFSILPSVKQTGYLYTLSYYISFFIFVYNFWHIYYFIRNYTHISTSTCPEHPIIILSPSMIQNTVIVTASWVRSVIHELMLHDSKFRHRAIADNRPQHQSWLDVNQTKTIILPQNISSVWFILCIHYSQYQMITFNGFYQWLWSKTNTMLLLWSLP